MLVATIKEASSIIHVELHADEGLVLLVVGGIVTEEKRGMGGTAMLLCSIRDV